MDCFVALLLAMTVDGAASTGVVPTGGSPEADADSPVPDGQNVAFCDAANSQPAPANGQWCFDQLLCIGGIQA
jgi:hypothetical protein